MKTVSIDFEYSQGHKAHPKLVCCCLKDSSSPRIESYWLYDSSQRQCLLDRLNGLIADRALFIAHAVELAEGRCFAELGISNPNVLWFDTMLVEHMLNNRPKVSHSGFSLSLVETLRRHKLLVEDVDEVAEHKERMRKIIISDDADEINKHRDEIVDYCSSDILLLEPLMRSQWGCAKKFGVRYCMNHTEPPYTNIVFGETSETWQYESADDVQLKWVRCFLQYSHRAWLFALIDSNGIPLKRDEVELFLNKSAHGLLEVKDRFHKEVANIYNFKPKKGRIEVTANQKMLQELIGSIVKTNNLGSVWPKSEKTSKWSLKDDVLKQFQHLDPRLEKLREHKKMCRALSSFTKEGEKNWLSSYDHSTGRIYPYHGFGMTQTFRNAHTPRSGFVPAWSKAMRTLQHPDEDHRLVAIDFKSEEFILGMDLRRDEVGQQAYADGDIYVATAKRMGLLPNDAEYDPKANFNGVSMKAIRGQAKALVLGLGYGMGAKSLATRIGVDEETAAKLIDSYKELYSDMFGNIEVENAILAHNSTMVLLPNGYNIRCPRLDKMTPKAAASYRKSVNNFPIQCGGAFILGEIVDRCFKKGLKIVTTVHDEVVVECLKDDVDNTIQTLSEIMIDSYEALADTRNVRVDPEVWGGEKRCDHLEDGNKSYFALLDILMESEDIDATFNDSELYIDEDFNTNTKEEVK